MRLPLIATALWLFAAGAAVSQDSGPQFGAAWARATPGGARTGVVYLTVTSPKPDRLVGAATPAAATAQLHEVTMSGMVMKMRPVPGIDLPAGKPVALKPGGLHIMLEGLKAPLRQGQSFPLELDFAKAGKRAVTVAVEKPGAMGPQP